MVVSFDEDNNIEYEVLAKFYLAETKKDYVVYTDGKYIDNKLNIFAFSSDLENDDYNDVTDDNEWNLIINKMKEIGFEGV